MDPEIVSDMRDRPAGLERQPDTALDQLLGILPCSWHRRRFSCPEDRSSSNQNLRETAWLIWLG
jgi:hypothetical protein